MANLVSATIAVTLAAVPGFVLARFTRRPEDRASAVLTLIVFSVLAVVVVGLPSLWALRMSFAYGSLADVLPGILLGFGWLALGVCSMLMLFTTTAQSFATMKAAGPVPPRFVAALILPLAGLAVALLLYILAQTGSST
ncbi:MAG: hypothetical protein Q7W30_04425 [Coriobacteriia bacterium]|nr:hypothetical protein [Coriobacteriia bacterium]